MNREERYEVNVKGELVVGEPTTLSQNEKKEISGMLGELDDNDKKALIEEVLTSLDYNLIVTPKEIDFLIDNLSKVIAKSIDKALHDAI